MATASSIRATSPVRRVYVDLPTRVAIKLDALAAEAGKSKKDYLADLILKAAERSERSMARA